ncbi:MAG: HlyD family efflux transporter periplasmic adaptor subunit [Planctomyces sp.]|nr:HlyD family efflux transporter periplasmic adaptor subunit [Planctomyces sp.]
MRVIGVTISFVLVVGLAAVAALWSGKLAAQGASTVAVPAGPNLEHVGALGWLEPQSEVRQIHAPAVMEPPRVHRMLVEEGEWVVEGDVFAILDTEPRNRAALREAQAENLVARRTLETVLAGAKPAEIEAQQAAVEVVRTNLKLSERQLAREKSLLESSATSLDSLDGKQSAMEALRSELLRETARLESLKEIRSVDIRQAEAEVARTAAAIENAEAELETSYIRSPIVGRVLRIHCRSGERIPDEGLLELGDTSRMDIVAEVHEADAPRVDVGQQATAVITTTGVELRGEVVRVGKIIGRKDVLSNDPVDDTDARVIEVRIRLDEDSSRTTENLSYAKVEVTIQGETCADSCAKGLR